MGNLKPGASYIYERADGVTYAREFGADANERFPIGWDYIPKNNERPGSTIFGVPVSEIAIYIEMMEAAKTNISLQEALDRAKIVYHLGKKENG
jgi:hypothetical protein